MFNNHLALIITVIGLLSLSGLRSIWPKSGSAPAVILILGVSVTAVSLPPASHALQIIQQEDPVIEAASQSIDDTLLITTTDATVHGDIKGSLFVAAEDVKVTGVISGNLITLADNVTISGSVGGTTVSLADSIAFEGAKIAGDLWLAGDAVKLDSNSEIRGNLASFGSSIVIGAKVSKDMLIAADRAVLSGEIGGDLNIGTKHISLLDNTRVEGKLTYRTASKDGLVLGDNVTIQGEIDYQGKPRNFPLAAASSPTVFIYGNYCGLSGPSLSAG